MEQALLQPEVRRSAERLDELLADGFREFGSSGRVYDKQAILRMLPSETSTADYVISDFDVERLAEGVVLATYTVTETAGGETMRSLRSSI